ncbi:uncharacterized protein LOC141618516 [Silene latifolia]|uniref:uncharacterized protein LOC141618516 n=1 Tax=Silene latifolia TaxID=37657 RepID=UPI003D786F5B
MAARLPPPTSSNRMGTVSFLPNLTLSSRCSLCFPIHLQYPSYDVKLYRVPMAHLRSLLTCAKARSAIVHGTAVGNAIGSTSPLIQRPDLFLDRSSHASNNADDFEKQLQELFDEVKTLISTGKMTDAIDLLQANYHAVKEQLGSGFSGIEEAATLDIIALGYMAIGDLKMVGSLLKVMSKIIDSLDDDEMILDSVLIHMGSMYSAIGNFRKSISMYERALKIVDNVYGKHDIFLVTPLLGLAKVLGSNGKASEAADIYKRVITIMESSYGADSANLILPLSCLGNLLLGQGKADDAENPFSRIVSIYTTLHGEKDGRVGMALCSVANVKCAQGDADEAIHLYRKALDVIKDSGYMALDDNVMEKMRIDLVELLHAVGRSDEGRELLEECLVITQKYKGKDHPSLATQFINLATSYSLSKNYAEAERLLRMSLRIVMKSVGPDDPSVTFPMLQLAVTLSNLRRDKEAERLTVDVLRIREAAFGKESAPVGEALDCLVSIQTRLGEDDDKLLDLMKRVLAIQEREFGYESEELLTTLKKIIYYLDKLGRKQEKMPLQRRLSVLREKYKHTVQY